jgi:hypothetical protein
MGELVKASSNCQRPARDAFLQRRTHTRLLTVVPRPGPTPALAGKMFIDFTGSHDMGLAKLDRNHPTSVY